jgi:hypothetical protein
MMPSLIERRAFHESGHIACALQYGVRIIAATIVGDQAYMFRDRYCPPLGLDGLEIMATLCLCGPASEEFFVGKFEDGSDRGDYQMARECLARQFDAPKADALLRRTATGVPGNGKFPAETTAPKGPVHTRHLDIENGEIGRCGLKTVEGRSPIGVMHELALQPSQQLVIDAQVHPSRRDIF